MKQQKLTIFLLSLLMSACITSQKPMQELYMAIHHRDVEKVEAILTENQEMLDLNEPFATGNTPLCLAVEREALHIAKLLLQHGADASRPGRHGVQPLHLATHRSMATLLLENGASPMALDSMGNTPLHKAKNAAVARLLLEKSADPELRNQHGFTPIEAAVIAGRVDVFDELAGNWVRLTAEGLERLRRLGKREPAMAEKLAGYQLPKDKVAKTPAAAAAGVKTTGGGVGKAPSQARPSPNSTPLAAPPPKPQPPIDKTCRECQGKGWRWLCAACGGTGQLFQDVPDGYGGTYRNYYPCTAGCNGTGKLPCSWCDGTKIDRRFWR